MTEIAITQQKVPKKTRSIAQYMKVNLREYGILIALIAIMVFFQFATDGVLFKPINITNLFLQNSYIIIMAVGMLLVIVAGHIDLSVGSIVGFIGALVAVLMVRYKWDIIPTTLVCLAAGVIIGGLQGYWVAFHKIPAFIVTLAGMLIFRGLTLALLQGQSVGPFPEGFQKLSSGFLPDPLGGGSGFHVSSMVLGIITVAGLLIFEFRKRVKQRKFAVIEEPLSFFILRNAFIALSILGITYLLASYKGLPNVLLIMAFLTFCYTFFTMRTPFGRRIYALGGNEKAARLSGIKTDKLTFFTFANMGLLAALAGLVFTARLNSATPKAGFAFELDVIAACFIGGASASGGVGKVIGAVVGALIMGVMNNGMSILGIGIDWQQIIKGLVLLLAVVFDVINKKKAALSA